MQKSALEPGRDSVSMLQAPVTLPFVFVRIPHKGYELVISLMTPDSPSTLQVLDERRVDVTEFVLPEFRDGAAIPVTGDAVKEALLAIEELTENLN